MMDRKFVLYSVVLCITVGVCYLKALDCGFAFDDITAVVDNKDLRPKTSILKLFVNDFWGTPMHKEQSHKSYRPLTVLTFRWNYMWSELNTMYFHLTNVVLHAVVCIMFMKTCMLFIEELPSFMAALLFAVHPVHTEAVTGVVGRAESLSSIFFLASLLVYTNCTGYHKSTSWGPLFVTIILVSIAMLCKEQGITVIGVCVIYEVFVAQRALFKDLWQILMGILTGRPNIPKWLEGSIIRSAVLVGTTLFLLIARIRVMGAQLPVFTVFDNPASVASTPTRQFTYNYLLTINFGLLLFPANLCCDWTMGTVPLLKSIIDPRNLVTVLFYVCFGKMVHFALVKQGRTNRAVLMSIALLVLPFIPASNMFFPVGFVVAERILYTPSMGFCMLVAVGFDALLQNKKSLKYLIWLFMSVLLLSHVAKTYYRNIDWVSEYSLFRSALKVNTRNAKCWNNVGHALEKEAKYLEALDYFEKAVSVQPDDIGAHMNVGRTYKNLKMTQEAEQAYIRAKNLFPPIIPGKSYRARVAPSHLNVFLNLAQIASMDPNRLLEADTLLKTATDMRPDYIQGYINRGDIMMQLGRQQEAITVYEKALQYEPDNADVIFNIGVVHMELRRKDKALYYFEEALRKDPDHWQSLYNSAVLIQEDKIKDKWSTAIARLNFLMERDANDSRPAFSMAMLAMDMEDYIAAEKYFKRTIELDPTFKSALFNLPLMMSNHMKKPKEAYVHLERLLQLYPDHAKGLMLQGELNVNVLKNLKVAEESFLKVLDLQPENIEAMHNLCVVYVERGDLFRAEKCLVRVHNMEPSLKYVLNHLNLVRQKIREYQESQKAESQKADEN